MKFIVLILVLGLTGCNNGNNENNISSDAIDYGKMLESIEEFHSSYELAIKENRLDDVQNPFKSYPMKHNVNGKTPANNH